MGGSLGPPRPEGWMLEVGWLQWVAAQAKFRVVLTNIEIPFTFRQFFIEKSLEQWMCSSDFDKAATSSEYE